MIYLYITWFPLFLKYVVLLWVFFSLNITIGCDTLAKAN